MMLLLYHFQEIFTDEIMKFPLIPITKHTLTISF